MEYLIFFKLAKVHAKLGESKKTIKYLQQVLEHLVLVQNPDVMVGVRATQMLASFRPTNKNPLMEASNKNEIKY